MTLIMSEKQGTGLILKPRGIKHTTFLQRLVEKLFENKVPLLCSFVLLSVDKFPAAPPPPPPLLTGLLSSPPP